MLTLPRYFRSKEVMIEWLCANCQQVEYHNINGVLHAAALPVHGQEYRLILGRWTRQPIS